MSQASRPLLAVARTLGGLVLSAGDLLALLKASARLILFGPPATRRVPVFGSSFAPPAGVEIEDAFHSRLDQRPSAGVQGLFYVDPRDAFGGKNPRDFPIRALDLHPNRGARAIFADVIDDYLRTQGLLGS